MRDDGALDGVNGLLFEDDPEVTEKLEDRCAADEIYAKYVTAYDDELQGCCLLIADEISNVIDGEVVAGELHYNHGCNKRTHWWVEKDGIVFDPMGDEFLEGEIGGGRLEVHRDRKVFEGLLPEYEKWRV